jgi:hypothetical protein
MKSRFYAGGSIGVTNAYPRPQDAVLNRPRLVGDKAPHRGASTTLRATTGPQNSHAAGGSQPDSQQSSDTAMSRLNPNLREVHPSNLSTMWR